MADWYTKIAEQVVGPLSADQLKVLADGGRLTPDDPVARSKEGPWVSAARVKGLFEVAAIDDEPEASAPQPVAQQSPPKPPVEPPPIPQPPNVMQARVSAQSSPPQPAIEPLAEAVPPAAAPGPVGGFAIQTEEVAATERFQKKKRVKKPKEPLTKKQKNARLVKWLAVAIVAGIVVFASIPVLRKLTRSAPETAPAKDPVAADVDLAATGSSLEDAFGTASHAVPQRPASRTSKAAQDSASDRQAKATEETVTAPAATGGVDVEPTRVVIDRPLMTSADGRTARPSNRFLLVEFELRSKTPDASPRFRGWLSYANEISLTDDRGVEYKIRTPQHFSGMFIDGQCRETTFLSAEKPTTDVIVFSWPEDEAPELPSASEETLKLRLPKSAYGEEGELRIAIPLSEIDVTEEALEKARGKPAEGGPTSDNVGEGDERIPIPGLQK